MTAKRHDAAAGPADVPEQLLEDRRGADDLDPGRVLRPADGVADGAGSFRARGGGVGVGDAEELGAWRAADPLDELRGVAGEMPLEQLVDAARMLQRLVARRADEPRRLTAAALAPQSVRAAAGFLR